MIRTMWTTAALLLGLAACGDGRRAGVDGSIGGDARACDPPDTCGCDADPFEPNDVDSRSTLITSTTLTSEPDSSLQLPGLTVHHVDDEDWISVLVDSPGGNPILTVAVSDVLSSSEYEVSAWYSCPESPSQPACSIGTTDDTRAYGGCVGLGAVSFESNCERYGGAVDVRVRAPSWSRRCETYQLDISVR